ncbi:MAG: hypothetical protein JJU11_01075 [Candidatus Sumerlaeia bacterium]|nr:hypothetical protein [Candidatus Sumerlaeia bacterium]
MPPKITWYVTSHGFGHAIRSTTVMEEVFRQAPEAQIDLRTKAPGELFANLPTSNFRITPVNLDCGTIDTPEWDVDKRATMYAMRAIQDSRETLIEEEVAHLAANPSNVVVFDVPWLAPVIARQANIPSVAIANFTWDQIYRPLARDEEEVFEVARIAEDYRKTTLGLRTPLSTNLPALINLVKIPLIARHAVQGREETRRELSLGEEQVVVLIALNQGAEDLADSMWPDHFQTVGFVDLGRENHKCLPSHWRSRFPDLVAVADLVLSKPGYGIASECIANRTPLIHLPRTNFSETIPLINDLDRMGKHLPVKMEELKSPGFMSRLVRWHARQLEEPWPPVETNGAAEAARRILRLASHSKG